MFSHLVKFLEFVKPFCAVLPEIAKPDRKVMIYDMEHDDFKDHSNMYQGQLSYIV